MTRLADIVASKRIQGGGVVSSLAGGIKERLKEKFDPRQLINQQGLLTALFPGLKSYSAKTAGSTIENSSIDVSDIKPIFEKIQFNTTISAKNLSVLPSIHRDFNVIRQNIIKLLKLEKTDAATRADMFFKAAAKREQMYEAQLNKIKEESKKPIRLESNTSSSSEKFFKLVKTMLFLGGIAGILYFTFKEVSDAIEKLKKVDLKNSFLDFTDTLENDLKNMIDSMIKKLKDADVEDLERGMEDSIKKSKDTATNKAKDWSDWWSKYHDGKKSDANKTIEKTIEKNDITNRNQNAPKAPSPRTPLEAYNLITGNDNTKIKKRRGILRTIGHSEQYTTIGDAGTVSYGSHTMPAEKGTISSYTSNYRALYGRPHYGIDIKMDVGSNVMASAAGTVTFAGDAEGYGNTIEILHPDRTKSLYGHLSKISVAVGDIVSEGKVIGLSGGKKGAPGAGGSTGPHLHYEIINEHGQAVEPAKVIPDLKLRKGKGLDVQRTTPIPDQSSLRTLGSNLDRLSLSNYLDDLNNQTPLIFINDNKIIQQQDPLALESQNTEKDFLNILVNFVV
jgi:murein DD-endopeptidase MepM/ murein hydrolase activator NlpD